MKTENLKSKATGTKTEFNKQSIIAALAEVGEKSIHFDKEQQFESGMFIHGYVSYKVGALVTGLDLGNKTNLLGVWLPNFNGTYKVGTTIKVDNLKLTAVSKIKYFEKDNFKGFAVPAMVAMDNLNIDRLEADCKNPFLNTNKSVRWFGTVYNIEPNQDEIDRFIELTTNNQELFKSLNTACNIAGFNFNKLFAIVENVESI